MEEEKALFDALTSWHLPLAGRLAVLLTLVVVIFDWTTWIELDVTIFYALPLLLAAVARSRGLLWALAAWLVFTTFAVYGAQIPPGAFALDEPLFINRVLSAITLILTAALLHAWILAARALAAQRLSLVEQNLELGRLRRNAHEANIRKTQLLSAVAHDINTPLTVINLIADLMVQSAGSPAYAEKIPDMVQRLRRNTDSLAALGTALVDVASLDAGQIAANPSEFSLNDLLEEERQRLLPLAQAKDLRFAVELPDPALRLLTDQAKLARVISNLVGNAFKFTDAGGNVTLTAEVTHEGSALIRVSDTGVGMSSEDLGRIFEEYGQLGNPERDSNKGWGLGLAICRRLMGVMGGNISVESERHRGTVFTVHLPASCVMNADPTAPGRALVTTDLAGSEHNAADERSPR